jgi:hypothetical protein
MMAKRLITLYLRSPLSDTDASPISAAHSTVSIPCHPCPCSRYSKLQFKGRGDELGRNEHVYQHQDEFELWIFARTLHKSERRDYGVGLASHRRR